MESQTYESKQKGDEGIYAAMDAYSLSQALKGQALSSLLLNERIDHTILAQLAVQQQQQQQGGGGGGRGAEDFTMVSAAAARVSHSLTTDPSLEGNHSHNMNNNGAPLGRAPRAFSHHVNSEVMDEVMQELFTHFSNRTNNNNNNNHNTQKPVVVLPPAATFRQQVPVAVPTAAAQDQLAPVFPLLEYIKCNNTRMNYDDYQQLVHFLETEGVGARVSTLDFSGALDVRYPAREVSVAALEAHVALLASLYPLPVAPAAGEQPPRDGEGEEGEDDDDEEAAAQKRAALQHNEQLQKRCEQLQIPYKNYKNALRDLAFFELAQVTTHVCKYLAHPQHNTHNPTYGPTLFRDVSHIDVCILSHNHFGAAKRAAAADPAAGGEGGEDASAARGTADVNRLVAEGAVDRTNLEAIARLIDTNETLRVLQLSHNELRANGLGLIAKALTKNVGLVAVDLSSNALQEENLELSEASGAAYLLSRVPPVAGGAEAEGEQVEAEAEADPVFGDVKEGLEALGEVLRKNKFLRVLRLADNGIHSGDDLTQALSPEEQNPDEPADGAALQAVEGARRADRAGQQANMERWESAPLWQLVSPLLRYHRLVVLDLSSNRLGPVGALMVATALSTNHSVQVLDLTDNNIGFEGLFYLSELVLAAPRSAVHTLVLRKNELGGRRRAARSHQTASAQRHPGRVNPAAVTAMEAFARALEHNQTIRRLLLSHNHLGAELSAALLRTIATVPHLEELDFGYNEACGEHATTFSPTVLTYLAAALGRQDPPAALHTLRFSGNNVQAQGAQLLFPEDDAAPPPACLRVLELGRNDLGADLAPLARLLCASAALRRLDLSYNSVPHARQLLPGLCQNRTLAELDLSHNKLGVLEGLPSAAEAARRTEAFAELLSAVAGHPALRVLDVSWNDLRGEQLAYVRTILCQPGAAPALARLDLSYNVKVEPQQARAVLQALAARDGLEVLSVSVPSLHPVTAAGAGAAAAAAVAEGGAGASLLVDVLRDIQAAADRSETLLQVEVGLRAEVMNRSCDHLQHTAATTTSAAAAAAQDADDEDTQTEKEVAQLVNNVQQKLLLNALLQHKKKLSTQ